LLAVGLAPILSREHRRVEGVVAIREINAVLSQVSFALDGIKGHGLIVYAQQLPLHNIVSAFPV
jgi:hypothetical protein